MENRKEVDFTMIKNATDKRPRTFTELLHVTKLSRKTLSLRLKDLCMEGFLTKQEGMYKWNGKSEYGNDGGHLMKGLSRMFDNKRLRTSLTLIALLTCFSVSGYVLAMIAAPTMYVQPVVEPKALGSFTMSLEVDNVKDLYAWQAAIVFNSSQIKVVEAKPGDFMQVEFPCFVNSTDTSDGLFLLCGTLEGNVQGKTGSGRLATIVFEYYVNGYELPSIASQKAGFETWLADSELATIPGGQTLLMLNVVG